VDGSNYRKNAPAAHVVLGVPCAINGACYAITDLVEKSLKFCPDIGSEVYARNITKFFRGTGIEIAWTDTFYCPTEYEYMAITLDKWMGYMNIALELMQHMTKNDQDIAKVTKILSWFYSIINDYSDYVSAPISEGKNLCDDMSEGKFTFPIIHAIKTKGNQEVYGEAEGLVGRQQF
jgi:geranylgeranyl diphosphate synthase, type III